MDVSLAQLEYEFLLFYREIFNNPTAINMAIKTSQAFGTKPITLADTAPFFDAEGNEKDSNKPIVKRYSLRETDNSFYEHDISDKTVILLYCMTMEAYARLVLKYTGPSLTDKQFCDLTDQLSQVLKILDLNIKGASLVYNDDNSVSPAAAFAEQLENLIEQKELNNFLSKINEAILFIQQYVTPKGKTAIHHPATKLLVDQLTGVKNPIETALNSNKDGGSMKINLADQKTACSEIINNVAKKIHFLRMKRLLNYIAEKLGVKPPFVQPARLKDFHHSFANDKNEPVPLSMSH
jgi:hypothetical protein